MPIPKKPSEVKVSQPWEHEWCVIVDSYQASPRFGGKATAAAVAAAYSAALRRAGVNLSPAVCLPSAQLLMEEIQAEIEVAQDAWYDDHRSAEPTEYGLGLWLDSLGSIELQPDGSMLLDYDQAYNLASTLPDILERMEDIYDHDDESTDDPAPIRKHGVQLQEAGFTLGFVGPQNEYRISLNPNASLSQEPYIVERHGVCIGATPTLAEAWNLVSTTKEKA